jgi:hypothetical protein
VEDTLEDNPKVTFEDTLEDPFEDTLKDTLEDTLEDTPGGHYEGFDWHMKVLLPRLIHAFYSVWSEDDENAKNPLRIKNFLYYN